ncbi:MAG: ketoacyl-ACP synthase III [Candidatus Delongbacteria bacterium]|nr:ketoacyl-ACP synthase III [Candidatus Delongbacteria bacterium]MBN2837018.1 ketoacyl-ACP synthase III [Candidatus Delongbacteria bacterium]
MEKKTNCYIAGTGHYLPETKLTNADLEKMMETTDEWITQMVGIKERHIVGKSGEVTSDLAAKAGLRAIEDAGLTPEDIQLIIVGTVTHDMMFPSTAIFVQNKIGAKNAAAFDISAACTGFIYGLTMANGMIASSGYDNILVIGVEYLTSLINWEDRGTAVLFGDGAGAVVLKKSNEENNHRGLLGSYIKSDGSLAELLWSVGGGTYVTSDKCTEEDKRAIIRMQGNKVYKYAVRAMIESAEEAMKNAGVTEKDIDILIPHQANMRIIDAIAKRVNLPEEKVLKNLPYTGNTSAASIPIVLDQAIKRGEIKKGDNVLIAAFGAGFTWGGAVIKI